METEQRARNSAESQTTVDEMIAVARAINSAHSGTDNAQVAHCLSLCCEAFENSAWPEVSWRFSGLTADGCPLEFTFSSTDAALRFTVDVAPPETKNDARIGAARDLATRLGYPIPPQDMIAAWIELQQGRYLSWGARLGIRARRGRLEPKIYVEVPMAGQQFIHPSLMLPWPEYTAVMVGYDPEQASEEYYFRQQQLSVVQLDRLLGMFCSQEERVTMRAGIERVCGMPVSSALEWICFGLSVALSRSRKSPPRLALFLRSSAIGGACIARERLLDSMLPTTKERSLYYRLFSALPSGLLPDHGVISISCHGPGVAEVRVGLSGMAISQLMQRSH